jgi:tetratricopeptide (TPR) repeat protein
MMKQQSSTKRPFPRASGGRTRWGRLELLQRSLVCATLFLLQLATPASADAPRGYIGRPLEPGVDYSQHAKDAYAAGIWTLDEIAVTDARASETTRPIYERAQAAFEEAVRAEPAMYEAHTYLGYIHRKLGRFDESLEAYATALQLKPDYVYAIEYQGEAYLALGDFDRARINYLRLYALDQEQAKKLLDAMDAWIGKDDDANTSGKEDARAWIVARRQQARR